MIKKIAIIGCAGSCKTTLAFKLARKLNLPLYHLDQYCWKPGWEKVDFELFKKTHDELCQKDEWIIEGSYYKLFPYRAQRADAIIFFDVPRFICISRVIKRALLNYGNVLPGDPSGCTQQLFTKRFLTFLCWIWNFNKKHRPEIMHILNKYENQKQIYVIKSSKDIDFLKF